MENNQNRKTEFEDIYSDSKNRPKYPKGQKPLAERDIYYPNKFTEFMLKNNKRNTKITFASLLVLVLGLVVLLGWVFFSEKYDMMLSPTDGYSGAGEQYTNPPDYKDNQNEAIHGVLNETSVDGQLKEWYNLGGIMDQDYVTNVLLLGIDGKNGVKNGGNSDSMILVSINRKTERITLVSFMRDSRTYYNNAENSASDRYVKLNSAFGRGGADGTVRAIENNYKIDIDYYVAVDFSSFADVVDALGGVTVDMKEYEQKYINRTTTQIKKIPNYGKVTLDGDQALVYCRIRKCDSDGDVSRTRRQRGFISALIASAKGASLSQLNNAVDSVLPHILTNCGKNEILSFAAQAISQGWLNYEIVQITMPDEDTRKDVYFPETIGGESYNIFYWVIDYPVAAQNLQKTIYGTTNITLSPDRESVFDYVGLIQKPENDSDSDSNVGSTDYTSDVDDSMTGEDQSDYTGDYEETTTSRPGIGDWITGNDEETTTSVDEEINAPTEETTTEFAGYDENGSLDPAA